MPSLLLLTGLVVLVGVTLTVTATSWWVTQWLRHRAILDHPVARSSHSVPTPRGGGWGVTPVVLLAWGLLAATGQSGSFVPLLGAGAVILLLVSWWDDLHSLSAAFRLGVQALVVTVGVAALPDEVRVAQGLLPFWLDRAAAAIGWIWFVNLFNFMDGIDGITGSQLATTGGGLALVLALSGPTGHEPALLFPYALALAGGGLGFLVWNWHPARVFLGDVGSVPLGYLTGWLLLLTAGHGLWLEALILPFYYLADASLTLLRRLSRGERIWQAHREHSYQKGVQNGLSHAQVVRRILLANILLLGCALSVPWLGVPALLPAALIVAILLLHLQTVRPGAPRQNPVLVQRHLEKSGLQYKLGSRRKGVLRFLRHRKHLGNE